MYGFGKMGSTILGSMSDLTVAGGAQTRRRPRKLTILLHPPEYAARHVGGVNALALAPNYDGAGAGANQLYTGGRDGTVRAWNVDGDVSEPTCAGTMEGHSSWVNALATVRSSSGLAVLLSGSSDRTIKAWALDGREGTGRDRCVSRVERHADYVTRLAAPTAPGSTRFASAGLGGDQVYLWDIEAVVRPAATAPREDAALVRTMEGQTDSAYALAMDAAGTTIVSGCSSGTVRVWDTRDSSSKPMKLRGHTGNARCAAMDPTGRLCITGSSDGTIRLWDVGQRRCVQTLGNVHRRGVGVWSVAMDESWHAAYSGGADGRVHVTDLARRRSAPLFQEPAGVVDLRLAEDGASVWAATMSSRVRRWSTRAPRDAGGAESRSDARRRRGEPGAWFSVASARAPAANANDAGVTRRSPSDGAAAAADPPAHAEPLATIAGAPPIVEHAQLTDRTRVLAKDAEGGLTLWDVTRFELARAWPPGTDFAATRDAESAKVSIPAWFQVDSRSGSLAVTLAPYSAFQAEAYAADMGLEGANDETKINIGAQTIHALLRNWAAARRAAAADAGDVGEDVGNVGNVGGARRDVNALRPSEDAGAYPSPRRPPILMFESPSGGGSTVLMPTACLQGTEEEEEALPDWIAETAAGNYRVPDAPKASFYLNPAPGQDLPALSQGKVTAPRVLGIRKVCVYVISKLNLDTPPDVAPDELVEIVCNGEVLDPKMSLATVKEYVWKRGDDVQLQYRLREGVKMKAEEDVASA